MIQLNEKKKYLQPLIKRFPSKVIKKKYKFFLLQLIYRIGRGYIKPDLTKIRTDCPKALKRLYLDCIKYNREERPQFKQVCVCVCVFVYVWNGYSSRLIINRFIFRDFL